MSSKCKYHPIVPPDEQVRGNTWKESNIVVIQEFWAPIA